MNSCSEVFRSNLLRLARVFELDFDGVSAAADLWHDDRKWLSRVWLNGLERADKRSRPRLKRLAKLFGLDDPGQMWIPDVEPNPAKLAKTLDRCSVGGGRWLNLVTEIANALRVIDRLWQTSPYEMSAIALRWTRGKGVQMNLDTNRIVAHWVAAKYGLDCLSDLEKTMIGRIESEFAVALKWENETSLLSRISSRIEQHPRFKQMVWHMYTLLDLRLSPEEYADIRSWNELNHEDKVNDGLPEDLDHQKLSDCLLRLICERTEPPISEDELYARFVKRYLGDDEQSADQSVTTSLRQIMDRLSEHPEWSTHIRKAYAGDFNAAEEEIANFWGQACINSNHTIAVDTFVHFYTSLRLDELAEMKQDTTARCFRKIDRSG